MEVCLGDERRPGIEMLSFRGEPGYQDEEIYISNSLSNGLRIEIANFDDEECGNAHAFHIKDPATARRIAERLIEWSSRIADPPQVP